MEKRQKLWKDFQEYREKRVEQWKRQKETRLQLRNCEYIRHIPRTRFEMEILTIFCLLDVDTDELSSDSQNHEEEVVEFFIKEEITVID